MNWDRVKGNWNQMTGSAKAKWGEISDDELTRIGGEREKLVGKVQEKYGLARDAAEKQVDEWAEAV